MMKGQRLCWLGWRDVCFALFCEVGRMDRRLLDVLACPVCKAQLRYDAEHQRLLCRFDALAYPVQDGVPVLLESEAMPYSEDQSKT